MPWYSQSWLNRKKITIQASQVPGDLTDYLATVSLRDADILSKSQVSGNDILFTSFDETTKIPHVLQKRELLVDHGVWSWFSNPRAVYHNNKTYWVSVADGGDVDIHSYDHSSGAINHFTLDPALEDDDHNHGAIYIRSDGRLFVMWGKHTQDNNLHYRISTNAEDIGTWGSRTTLALAAGRNTTYQNPIYLNTPGKLVMVYRSKNQSDGTDTEWRYIVSDDEGSTWNTTETPIWKTATSYSGYFIWAKNGADRADLIFTNSHPTFDSSTSTYHMYLQWDAGTSSIKFYKSNGTEITSAKPYGESDATLVWDGSVESSWIWDVVIDGSGNPHLAFTRFPTQTDHRYYYTSWSGSAWTTPVQITSAGNSLAPANEPNYSGGIYFNRAASIPHDEVYLVIESSNVFELQKWTYSAGWAKTEDITTGSTAAVKQGRPIVPWGQPAGKRLEVLWWSGFYDHNITFRTPMYGYPQPLNNAIVKIPTVSGSTATDIYCYYNNVGASNQQDALNTYTDVYADIDFDLPPGKSKLRDLSGNNAVVTTQGHNTTVFMHAEDAFPDLGNAVKFVLGSDHFLTFEQNLAGLSQYSIDAVVKWASGGANEHVIVSNWGSSDESLAQVLLRLEPADNTIEAFSVIEPNTQVGTTASGLSIGTTVYEQVSFLFDTTDIAVCDSDACASVAATGATMDADTSPTMYVGRTHINHPGNVKDFFSGIMSALRISKTRRSFDYQQATSNNRLNQGAFYTLGAESEPPVVTTANLSGASGTGQAGNINSIGAALLTLAGASASGQAGTITVTAASGETITLSGVSVSGSAGAITATGAALLTATGVQSTGQLGTLSATGGALFGLSGAQGAGQAGTLSATGGAILNLGGAQATGQSGSITSLGGALSGLTGVSSEGQPGTVTIQVAGGVSITLSGTQSTGQAGTITTITGASFALSGVASTGQAGTLTVTTAEGATVTLTGVQAAGGAGDIGILTGATVSLSGAVGAGQSGTVTVTIPGAITIDLTFKTAFVLSAEDTSLTLQ